MPDRLVLDRVTDDVSQPALAAATQQLWNSIRRHPPDASCYCPLLEALVVLYERGYRITNPTLEGTT